MSFDFPGPGLDKNKPTNSLSNREKSVDLNVNVTSFQFVISI